MYNNFEEVLEEALNSKTITEVEKGGRLITDSEYRDTNCDKITIRIYELENKLYLIKYINGECVRFFDIS